MKTKTLFKFKVAYKYPDGTIDWQPHQERYVVARSEEEAVAKLERHSKQLKKDGFCELYIASGGFVDVENVIV